MKFYHIIIAIALLNISGIAIAKWYYQDTPAQQFKKFGQYEPEMILLDHNQMLLMCEKHNLIYNYEEGICK